MRDSLIQIAQIASKMMQAAQLFFQPGYGVGGTCEATSANRKLKVVFRLNVTPPSVDRNAVCIDAVSNRDHIRLSGQIFE